MEQFKEDIKNHVAEVIKITVNGKIDKISDRLDNYIKGDVQWKEDVQPAITNMKNLTAGWKIVLATVTSIGAIAGATIAIRKLFGI